MQRVDKNYTGRLNTKDQTQINGLKNQIALATQAILM